VFEDFCEILEVSSSQKTPSAWYRRLRLIQRSTVWWPTWLGLLCAAAVIVLPLLWWCICGESFLSLTRRLPSEVLVVEGWIGYEGIRAAAAEFKERGYQYVVPTGDLISERWDEERVSYAEMAQNELIRAGVPRDRIIVAPAKENATQRTYGSAVAVRQALQGKGILPKTLNVFTWGPHARRSLLVFTKVNRPETNVGVISWLPPGYQLPPWWRSSERARELLTETAGYLFEFFLNSGRVSRTPGNGSPPDLAQDSDLELRIAAQ
jgi:hypothetical protein